MSQLKSAPLMQSIVAQIAAKHDLDLSADEAHLRLEQEPYMPLVIEKVGLHLVSVAHYFYQNGDAVADPDVVFFTGLDSWVPIEITQSFGGYQRYVQLSSDGKSIERFSPRGQADLARFCHMWARNVKAQCWLKQGIRSERT